MALAHLLDLVGDLGLFGYPERLISALALSRDRRLHPAVGADVSSWAVKTQLPKLCVGICVSEWRELWSSRAHTELELIPSIALFSVAYREFAQTLALHADHETERVLAEGWGVDGTSKQLRHGKAFRVGGRFSLWTPHRTFTIW